MASPGLSSAPLLNQGFFNWTYLVEFIVDGILALFFLFYFNRVFATAVSYGIRLYTWHKFRVYIDIEAIQTSLLAGRIFFKGVRYHGDNVTVVIHGGYVTWRYWLRSVQGCDLFTAKGSTSKDASGPISEDGEKESNSGLEDAEPSLGPKAKRLPCRISIKVSGVEAFVYNRTPAYDAIIQSVENQTRSQDLPGQRNAAPNGEKSNHPAPPSTAPALVSTQFNYANASSKESDTNTLPLNKKESDLLNHGAELENEASSNSLAAVETTESTKNYKPPSPPSILRLLPIHVECEKGAAVLGSENTKSIITAKFDSASGHFDASRAGALDFFKILMSFDVSRPVVQMKPNLDYSLPQLAEAAALKRENLQDEPSAVGQDDDLSSFHKFNRFKLVPKFDVQKIGALWPWGSKSSQSIAAKQAGAPKQDTLADMHHTVSGHQRWLGLKRYIDDGANDEHDEWDSVEYAKSSTLADITSVGFKFFWDIPGPVPPRTINHELNLQPMPDDINGTTPPEYGMEIAVRGGQVSYGPWADRHRIILQQLFFPAPYANALPANPLTPGETRFCSVFTLLLSVEGDTVLRLPFREPSKDWRWKGRAAAMTGQGSSQNTQRRPRGRRKSAKATKRDKGSARTDIRPFAWFDVKVSQNSTVSYKMDMVANRTGYRNDLGVDVSGLEIFSSLNHGLLWRSGRVAMTCDLSNPLVWNGLREWRFNMDLNSVDLFLLRDHTFLLVDLIEDWTSGPPQDFYTFAPYRYLLNVHFQRFKMYLNTNDANLVNNQDDLSDNNFLILYGRSLDADLVIPLDRLRPVHNDITMDVSADDLGFELSSPPKSTLSALVEDNNVATLRRVVLKGIYNYCVESNPGMTDTFSLDITGTGFSINFFGFVAHHLIRLKENYFGEDIHFRTLEEYQDLLQTNFEGANNTSPSTKSNDLDVILDITAIDATINLPAGIYDCKENVWLSVDTVNVDLRVTNYYLELMVNSYPLELGFSAQSDEGSATSVEHSGSQLFIDGVKVYGHRLFGLAPREPTYVSNWDVNAGKIAGDCSDLFLVKFARAAQSFALTFNDTENAMPVPHIIPVHDATFVRFQCPEIRIGCHAGNAAFLVDLDNVHGTFDDWAGKLFSQRLKMFVPKLAFACVDGEAVLRHRDDAKTVETYAYVQTAVTLTMVQRSVHFEEQKALQQQHIRFHDRKRHRSPFLVHSSWNGDPATRPIPGSGSTVVSIPLPTYPQPLNHVSRDTAQFIDPGIQYPDQLGVSTASHRSPTTKDGRPDFAKSNFAFASPFKCPPCPLAHFRPDVHDVPLLPRETRRSSDASQDQAEFDTSSLDDDAVHTSVIVDVDPGVTAYFKPKAIYAVAQLVQAMIPQHPTDILDQFQFQTVMKVISKRAIRRGKRTVTDVNVTVPFIHVRFVNEFGQETDESTESMSSDRYNCIGTDIAVLARIRLTPETKFETGSSAIHASVDSLRVTAQEGVRGAMEEDAAFQVIVRDVLVWLSDSERTLVNASFRTTEAAVTSKTINYLAKLIHRTVILVDEAQTHFLQILREGNELRRLLVYTLIIHGQGIPDPAYLTRPSNFIRSTKDHIRNSDSWKILSKLQYTFQSLRQEDKLALRNDFLHGHAHCPVDSEQQVLAELDQWRKWDKLTMTTCVAVQVLYGPQGAPEGANVRSSIPLDLVVHAAAVKLIIDPGNKQNMFSVDGLALKLSITPPPPTAAFKLFQEYEEPRTTIVQVNTAWISLRMNWSICEFVDQLLSLFEMRSVAQSDVAKVEVSNGDVTETQPEKFHCVFSSEMGDIQLEAINLKQTFASEGLKISITGSGGTPQEPSVSVNTIVAADIANAEMVDAKGILWKSVLSTPNLWIAYEMTHNGQHEVECLKVAGSSSELKLEVHQEILDLIQVVNAVVANEAAYLDQVIRKHGPTSSRSRLELTQPPVPFSNGADKAEIWRTSSRTKDRERQKAFAVNVVLFLNVYDLEVPILKDLSYHFVGKVMRTAVNPHPALDSTYQVNCDLKHQTHRILNTRQSKREILAAIKMPPINATVRLFHSPSLVTVSLRASMEKLHLEGATLYNVIGTFGSTRFTSAMETIKSDVLEVVDRVKSTFPNLSAPRQQHPKAVSRIIIFDGDFILVGLSVSADAPAINSNSNPSHVVFDLSTLQVRVANRSPEKDKALPFPEMRIALQQITLEIRRIQNRRSKTTGQMFMSALFTCTIEQKEPHRYTRNFRLRVVGPAIELQAESATALVEILSHLQHRLADLDLKTDHKYIRKFRHPIQRLTATKAAPPANATGDAQAVSFVSNLDFNLQAMRLAYVVGDSVANPSSRDNEDLALTLNRLQLLTRSEDEARLRIDELQLALVPPLRQSNSRPRNSALLPEIVFNVAHKSSSTERKLAFQLHGKVLDLQLDPQFILPISDIHRSLTIAVTDVRRAAASLRAMPNASAGSMKSLLGQRKLSLLLFNASFGGAEVHLQGRRRDDMRKNTIAALNLDRVPEHGRYNQFSEPDSTTSASLTAPGIAVRIQYEDDQLKEPALNVEFRIDASTNVLYPGVVPLMMQISDSVQKVVQEPETEDEEEIEPVDEDIQKANPVSKMIDEDSIVRADPRAILGRTKLNVGFRICKQEFGLRCQPIARVAASTRIDDIYITVNTVESQEHGNFFAASAALTGLSASLKHDYSRDATFSFDMESIVMSVMNNKHLDGANGVSAILRVNPAKTQINAKQLQDILLFREIWLPPEIRNAPAWTDPAPSDDPQEYFVQRYQQVAASTAFPWSATVAVAKLEVDLDLGQAIGKMSFNIADFWASSKKTTSSRQNLSIGIDDVRVSASGRMSGFVALEKVKVRTFIHWPPAEGHNKTPLIQGSIGFGQLEAKAAYDYQAFACAYVTNFEFIMYNTRDERRSNTDRLVALLDGDKVNAYCIASAAALGLSLAQAFERLIQETKSSYDQALRDIERFLRRRPSVVPQLSASLKSQQEQSTDSEAPKNKVPISLQTDVVVTLRGLDVGCFPSTLLDHQVLKGEASEVQARFAVVLDGDKIHTGLGLTLGLLRVGLASVAHPSMPKTLGEITVSEVARNAVSARGGTILRVPKVISAMQTWQANDLSSNVIEYIFKSRFEGNIDVGWNYSRIGSIKAMWKTHSKTLASRLGKPLPEPALKITSEPHVRLEEQGVDAEARGEDKQSQEAQQKITAVVNLPQSKYIYRALEPPIIDTPQLQDLGEATPPLEWIGLHRDRLPNVTHQIIIVTLLEVAKEVEDAYSRILGSA